MSHQVSLKSNGRASASRTVVRHDRFQSALFRVEAALPCGGSLARLRPGPSWGAVRLHVDGVPPTTPPQRRFSLYEGVVSAVAIHARSDVRGGIQSVARFENLPDSARVKRRGDRRERRGTHFISRSSRTAHCNSRGEEAAMWQRIGGGWPRHGGGATPIRRATPAQARAGPALWLRGR